MRDYAKKRRASWRGAASALSEERYRIAERLASWLQPEAILSERARIWLTDDRFRSDYRRFDQTYYRRMDRIYTVSQFAQLIPRLTGDTAECGTYTGATSYFICQRLLGTGKKHFCFDSWEGLSAPQEIDGDYWTRGDLLSSEDEARRNLAKFSFVEFHKGWIPERFVDVADREFCLVHIDVDLHDPTHDSLEFFWPRLVSGGIIILDDHGFVTCPGARTAALDFFANKPERVLDLTTGQGLVIKGWT
jgi:O-methyltransferase